ncbi:MULTISPECIES: aldehyde dehydrogenase family protein [Paenibacillus]|uniref:3-sulfolactaldehyde dehydrogenase n=1 Tax=Paenibacillus naphthalenovorans TaxID=162209 RepID=A0A0U2M595_9BACL|nr:MULTISPECIES: aldehyde dehydrogenase family protein [Paenibacillus]ALS22944.1 aldehyde dehydrogenase [Paenibacillus naphthalenovorans]GCL71994.1 aldehyde dehydrogenase [Paenibacillus naphthalenovorans]SDI44605.1 aldehyde dehydrogenase (NAD+) [Paenibacillus naphthalenovorans]
MGNAQQTAIQVNNYIGGRWVASESGEIIQRENPANTSEIVAVVTNATKEETIQAVESAHEAFQTWSKVPAVKRAEKIYNVIDVLERRRQEVAELLTREMGKPIKEAHGEITKAINEARYSAGEALRLTGETLPSERAGIHVRTIRVPKGVIAAISPWNFPLVTPLRKIVPALAAGNTVVFKPATVTAAMGAKIIELFEEAGLPAGVLNLIVGSGRSVGNTLVSHPLVKGVTFTGSTAVGSGIYKLAAERLIEVQLEMGGKNAGIIYDYPDVNGAVDQILAAAFAASGQRCTSISRIVVQRSRVEEVTRALTEKLAQYVIGDGMSDKVNMGPLVSQDQLDTVEQYVRIGLEEGAVLAAGGKRPSGVNGGYYYEPTVFTNAAPDMRIAREEIFGPVLVVIPVDSFDEAVQVANNSEYGLAVSCFTHHMPYAEQAVEEIETGMIHINNGTISESHVPFGGLKHSAVGPYSIGSTGKDFLTALKVVYSSSK